MAITLSGYEWSQYYHGGNWLGNWWYEDEEIYVNGVRVDNDAYDVKDTDIVKIVGGWIKTGNNKHSKPIYLLDNLRQWRKAQLVDRIVVEFDKTKKEEILNAIKAGGGKVVKLAYPRIYGSAWRISKSK